MTDFNQIDDYNNTNTGGCSQRNGQRIYRGSEGFKGGPPGRGCEVYVTRIPRDCFEKELLPVFTKVGPIYEHRLMMEQNGLNRGYAYVQFTNIQDAKEAVKKLNNHEIRPGRHLVVTKSVDNRRLWVNGIPKNRNSQEIRAEMERLTGGVREIIMYPSQADKTKSRGYMFVEYDCHRSAAMARKKLIKGNFHIYGQEIGTVDWAEPEHDVDEETMSTVRILFVRNLMLATTEQKLREIFCRLSGDHESVERVKKTKDYAFVHFTSRASAERALKASRELRIDEAEVEVVWSKPVDKQSYNTRKALTKVFTASIPADSATVATFGARRRGAAGIRGLGAPGTAPPKQLVQRMANMGGAGGVPSAGQLPPIPRHLAFKSPVDQLADVSVASGWGEPVYSLVPHPDSDQEVTQEKFCYKVTLPSLPLPAPHNSFQTTVWRSTADEAKCEAAGLVLSLLRMSPEYLATTVIRPEPGHGHPIPPHHLYPHLSPAHLQGVPLTAGWQAAGYAVPGVPAAGLYGRLPYSDPYSGAAYASMLSSMYGLSIAV